MGISGGPWNSREHRMVLEFLPGPLAGLCAAPDDQANAHRVLCKLAS